MEKRYNHEEKTSGPHVWTRHERGLLHSLLMGKHRTPAEKPRLVKGTFGLIVVVEDPAPEWKVRVSRAVFRITSLEADGGVSLVEQAIAWARGDEWRVSVLEDRIGRKRHPDHVHELRRMMELNP